MLTCETQIHTNRLTTTKSRYTHVYTEILLKITEYKYLLFLLESKIKYIEIKKRLNTLNILISSNSFY